MLKDLEPLAASWGTYAFVVLLGLLWGSFANVCIYRWPPSEEFPNGRSVVAPGSHCFACKAPVRWYDNVPLLSWLWLRGKCRSCQAPFSARYLIVEAVTGALFAVAWYVTVELGAMFEPFDQRLLRFAIYAGFSFVMVVISFIDLDHKLILDKVTLPSIVIFYGLGLLLGRSWYQGLVGIAIGYGLPWAVGVVYWVLTEREGLGLGDSKLLALVGALLGTSGVIASLFGGAMLGSVIGVLMLLLRQPAPAKASDEPPASRASALLAVVAVASVVAATVGALSDRVALGIGGSICALVALVVSRRLDPLVEDDAAAEPETEVPPSQVPGRKLAARLLAIVGGAGVVFAVICTLFSWLVGAVAGAVLGLGLLLPALRMHEATIPPIDETELPPEDDAPSLLRTELPFGPFLAMSAMVFLFAEPWIVVNFRLPGG
ncbi:MAG: prepilin peptidase [Kofleriaceae bacterium]|nr:prepilin peptidase [Kofleriaceae bacterium]